MELPEKDKCLAGGILEVVEGDVCLKIGIYESFELLGIC